MRRISAILVPILIALLGAPPAGAASRRIVYSDALGFSHDHHIFSIRPDGTGRRRLTNAEASDIHPRWSPDGRWIAFTRDRGDRLDLWIVRPDGSGARRIARNVGFNAHSWSPGSRRLVTTRYAGSERVLLIAFVADREPRMLSFPPGIYPVHPDWSPESSRLVFADGNFPGGIFTVDTDGHDLDQVSPDGSRPEWSPSGDRIAFTTTRDDTTTGEDAPYTSQVYVMDADGSDPIRISSDDQTLKSDLEWSPNGAGVAFLQGCDFDFCENQFNVVVANADGSGDRKVTRTEELWEESPVVWSPSGRRLLFGRWRRASYRTRLVTIRPDGSELRRIWPRETHLERICCRGWDW